MISPELAEFRLRAGLALRQPSEDEGEWEEEEEEQKVLDPTVKRSS